MVIIVTGPTASGKTWLAEQLIQRLDGAMINADVGQFYTACSVGTAKPDWQAKPYQSYLFDWLDTPSDVTVVAFKKAVDEAIARAQTNGKVPIIVGGSAFYVKSLFFQPVDIVPVDPSAAAPSWEAYPTQQLFEQLQLLDPVRAAELYSTDRYRIERALTLWHITGKLPSTLKPTFVQPYQKVLVVALLPPREQLEQRIAARLAHMLEVDGWIEEARHLLNTPWESFIVSKGLVGYAELFAWLRAGGDPGALPSVADAIR
ncbi:hypothetical protein EBZ39_16245, partial [bacterium]|nr:hypothetical protein [bacterium]